MSNAVANTIDTSKVTRRTLRFESLDQVLAEVDQLVEAEAQGRLRYAGNWTLGQTLNHLGQWAQYSYIGAPLKVPFFIKWILRLRKKQFLYSPMRPGVRIPRIENGTLATESKPLAEALPAFRASLERLRREAPQAPNTIFGPLTHEEWIAINLRHSELHLSFMTIS